MKTRFLIVCILLVSFGIKVSGETRQEWIARKNYPLVSAVATDADAAAICAADSKLKAIAAGKHSALQAVEAEMDGVKVSKWTKEEMDAVVERLSRLYSPKNALGRIVSGVRESGDYFLYAGLPDKEFIQKAFRQDAEGMNTAIATYAEGAKNRYAKIDSVSFDVNSRAFRNVQADVRSTILKECSVGELFFSIPLKTALRYLEASDRDEAADYEPLASGENAAPTAAVAAIDWKDWPYTVILVPGAGPEIANQPISPTGKLRCAYAADLYKEGKAPFIIVSGGRVHPRQTPYIEAVEMKRYLVEECGVPASSIFIEPHARHTTTNFRNAARIMKNAGIPMDRKALVSSSKFQIDYILSEKFSRLCMKMMMVMPFSLGDRLCDRELEFTPNVCATQRAPIDPLDP